MQRNAYICSDFLWHVLKVRETYFRPAVSDDMWLNSYHKKTFFELFRVKKDTFKKLVEVIIQKDEHGIIKKIYRGGNYPVHPEKSVLIFLWYMATQDSFIYIGDRFNAVPSTVMHIINSLLFLTITLKKTIIFWPKTEEEFTYVTQGFKHYPGTVGAVDGTHINLKITPKEQQDSYIDRFMKHSINLMAICTADKIFTKSVEIATAACILHNFCYINRDEWNGAMYEDYRRPEEFINDNREETRLGQQKRREIAESLILM
ncbi:hypothetical protein NQ314_018399 [Rhamnusium bicolor]|uniref:DDE Tnp4 domain-containing protein n=1 Tax=Rhamnusium bicolor TaxID=1586634 RepID=A0AAV8WS24_9CUCU|nr:hypothetical protein NQ314_018399 [Rhamnusium bicolor]